MTTYLQRLLDRAAGAFPTADVGLAPARPALASGSPILAFDQRLGHPDLAADFGILGAPADPGFAEDARIVGSELPGPLAERARSHAAEPLRAGPMDGPQMRSPPVAPEPTQAEPLPPAGVNRQVTVSPPPAAEALAPRPRVEPPAPVIAAAQILSPSPPAAAVLLTADAPPSRAQAPFDARQYLSTTESILAPRSESRPQADPVSLTAVPDREAPRLRTLHHPADAPATMERSDVESVREPVRPLERPERIDPRENVREALAEPVVAAPPPLASPPAGPGLREIEKLVEKAVRAELDRRPPAPTLPPAPARGQAAGEAAEPAAKRPASAAEASVIGKLERSSFSPMLFGVRRR